MLSDTPVRISCLVDTDIVIDFLRRREYARDLLLHWTGLGLAAISVLTHIEIFQGMRPREEEQISLLFNSLLSIPIDELIARRAGAIIKEQRAQGSTIGIADAIIAASAMQMNVPLLTNNVGHYQVPGIIVIRGFNK